MQASLFYLLVLIHLIVDFMQPSALVKWSKSSLWGLVTHSGIYLVLNALVLAFTPLWWLWTLIFGISHFVIDKLKVVLNDRIPQAGLIIFILDQAIHLTIIASVFFIARLGVLKPSPMILEVANYPRTLLYAIVYIAVTFGGSILIFEVLNSLGVSANSKSVLSFKERFQGIVERAIAVTFILSHLGILFPLAFTPSLIQGKRVWQSKDKRKNFLLEFITSLGLVLSAGIILYFM